MDAQTLLANVREIADSFTAQRAERQQRRNLDLNDFHQLREAGFLLTGVPAAEGGLWQSARQSTRGICEVLRTIARGDSSVALVSSMHPAVLVFWLASPKAPGDGQQAWDKQRVEVFHTVLAGHWWGTITSEPGSGGDIAKTKTAARHDRGRLRAFGPKTLRQRLGHVDVHDHDGSA